MPKTSQKPKQAPYFHQVKSSHCSAARPNAPRSSNSTHSQSSNPPSFASARSALDQAWSVSVKTANPSNAPVSSRKGPTMLPSTQPQTAIYFGGTRGYFSCSLPLGGVVREVIGSGYAIHVGCQSGVDQATVSYSLLRPSSLFVFAVAPTPAQAPLLVVRALHAGASVTFAAGGTVAPLKARYLLRSKAALAGCEQAVFFKPGPGSLAVARECVKASIPVTVFSTGKPARIPEAAGYWQFIQSENYFYYLRGRSPFVWQWRPRQEPLF